MKMQQIIRPNGQRSIYSVMLYFFICQISLGWEGLIVTLHPI